MMARIGCNYRPNPVVGWTCYVSRRLESLLDAIKLTFLSPFICKVRDFMLKLGKLHYTSRGFDILASLKKWNESYTWNKKVRNDSHSS